MIGRVHNHHAVNERCGPDCPVYVPRSADLHEENRQLRARIAELEEEIRRERAQ